MRTRLLTTAIAAMLLSSSASYAGTISSTYTAVATETSGFSGYAPTVTKVLPSPFTETLSVGKPSTATDFIKVAPKSGGSLVGTIKGTVDIAFTFSSATVTSVANSSGGNPAKLVNGTVDVSANYLLFYGTNPQTDCITWSTTTCTADEKQNVNVGDVVTVNFSNGAILAINLYNWADWDMTPDISFTLVKDPTAAPEPMSVALLGSAMAGLGLIRRSRKGATVSAV